MPFWMAGYARIFESLARGWAVLLGQCPGRLERPLLSPSTAVASGALRPSQKPPLLGASVLRRTLRCFNHRPCQTRRCRASRTLARPRQAAASASGPTFNDSRFFNTGAQWQHGGDVNRVPIPREPDILSDVEHRSMGRTNLAQNARMFGTSADAEYEQQVAKDQAK